MPVQLGPPLKDWVEAPDVGPYREIDGRRVVEVALGKFERYTPTDQARDDYLTAYEGERFAESMSYVRAYPAELPILADLLPGLQTPVQIIAGERDSVVPAVNARFLHQRLPDSRLAFLDAGHFVWEDSAEDYATFVTSWWSER